MSQAIYIIFLLIFAVNLILTRADIDDLKSVTLKDVTSGKFRFRGFNGIWTSGKEFVYLAEEGLVEFDVESGTNTVLLDQEVLKNWNVASVVPGRSKKRFLIKYNQTRLYLNQEMARFGVYETKWNTTHDLADGEEMTNCNWSPSTEEIACVYDNEIYYVYYQDGDEYSTQPMKLSEFNENHLWNSTVEGVGDWIYYETVFQKTTGIWFSPNQGSYMAFIWLNTSLVANYSFVEYGDPEELGVKYPKTVTFKLPQAGMKIPDVELHVRNRYKTMLRRLRAPGSVGDEPILASVAWVDEDTVAAMWMNRAQTRANIRSCIVDSPSSCETLLDLSEPNGWIDPDSMICTHALTLWKKCWIRGNVQGWKSLIEIDVYNKTNRPITPPGMTVYENYGYDVARQHVFIAASGNGFDDVTDPVVRHVYRITADGDIECISCDLETPEGNLCTYATASFSKDRSNFALTCSGPDPMFVTLFSNGEKVRLVQNWELNSEMRETLAKYKTTPKMTLRVPTVAGNFSAMLKLYLPPCFDSESAKKYPMVVSVYGDANSIDVKDNFEVGYADYLAQSRGVVTCLIDARGSGNLGLNHLFAIKNKLGQVEVNDYIEVVQHLIKTYKFIDRQRIGIWGRRYGGYATAMTLAKDEDGIFQGGISLSPISSFYYHTAIYMDRLLGLPQENEEAYEASDLNQYAERFLGKKYLLIHGTANDQIPFLHSMMWAKSLQRAGVLFEQSVYSDEDIFLRSSSQHVYETMDEFWTRTIRITQWDALCEK